MIKMQIFKRIKPEIRILAVDDGPFKFKKGKTILLGTIFRGGSFMDGLLKTEINVDGTDAEKRLISIIKKSKFKDLRVIMLDGITFGGFNTVNIKNICKQTNLPVIVVNRKKPDFEKFKAAIRKLPNSRQRLKAVEDAGQVYWADVRHGEREGKICFQIHGLNPEDARQIIKTSTTRSLIPEPLRIAHIIATGVVLGESLGRA